MRFFCFIIRRDNTLVKVHPRCLQLRGLLQARNRMAVNFARFTLDSFPSIIYWFFSILLKFRPVSYGYKSDLRYIYRDFSSRIIWWVGGGLKKWFVCFPQFSKGGGLKKWFVFLNFRRGKAWKNGLFSPKFFFVFRAPHGFAHVPLLPIHNAVRCALHNKHKQQRHGGQRTPKQQKQQQQQQWQRSGRDHLFEPAGSKKAETAAGRKGEKWWGWLWGWRRRRWEGEQRTRRTAERRWRYPKRADRRDWFGL